MENTNSKTNSGMKKRPAVEQWNEKCEREEKIVRVQKIPTRINTQN